MLLEEDLNKILQYLDVDYTTAVSICKCDPTFIDENKPGLYSRWLLKLYMIAENQDEELNRILMFAESLLDRFHEIKTNKKYKIKSTNINDYKSLQELENALDEAIPIEQVNLQKEKDLQNHWEDVELLFSNDDWDIYTPISYAGACTLGKDTKWCTSDTKQHKAFDSYSKNGTLYILINRQNNKIKYQFYFESNPIKCCMADNKTPVFLNSFFTEYPDICDFFKNQGYITIVKKALDNTLIQATE